MSIIVQGTDLKKNVEKKMRSQILNLRTQAQHMHQITSESICAPAMITCLYCMGVTTHQQNRTHLMDWELLGQSRLTRRAVPLISEVRRTICCNGFHGVL